MAARRYDFADDLLTQIKDPTSPVASTSHLLYDALGSTRSLTTDAGTLGESYNYTPFGTPLDFSLGSSTTSHLFAGEWFDAGTGYSYNRARWYDTGTGRFTATDAASDGINKQHRFAYGANNPVSALDPSGNTTFLEVQIVQIIVSIIVDEQMEVGRWAIRRSSDTALKAALADWETVTWMLAILAVAGGLALGGIALFRARHAIMRGVGKLAEKLFRKHHREIKRSFQRFTVHSKKMFALERHWTKHGKRMGYADKKEYNKGAQEFAQWALDDLQMDKPRVEVWSFKWGGGRGGDDKRAGMPHYGFYDPETKRSVHLAAQDWDPGRDQHFYPSGMVMDFYQGSPESWHDSVNDLIRIFP